MAGGGNEPSEPMLKDDEADFNLKTGFKTNNDSQNSELFTSLMQESQGRANTQRTYNGKNGRSRTSSPSRDQSLNRRRKNEKDFNMRNMNNQKYGL